jgi:hypothetical protein
MTKPNKDRVGKAASAFASALTDSMKAPVNPRDYYNEIRAALETDDSALAKRVEELEEVLGYAAQVLPDAMALLDRGLHKDSFNAISSVYGKTKLALAAKGAGDD